MGDKDDCSRRWPQPSRLDHGLRVAATVASGTPDIDMSGFALADH